MTPMPVVAQRPSPKYSLVPVPRPVVTRPEPRPAILPETSLVSVRGFPNEGNTCFRASVLQMLFHAVSGETEYAHAYRTGSATCLHASVVAKHHSFRGNLQHDAHEYALALLGERPIASLNTRTYTFLRCGSCSFVQKGRSHASPVISLPLSQEPTVECAVKDAQKEEISRARCDRCHAVCDMFHAERFELGRAVIVHWKRFDASGRKLAGAAPTGPSLSGRKLQAALYHHGSAAGGHYTCRIANPAYPSSASTRWLDCNDDRVTAAIDAGPLADAYMLLYA